MEPAQTQDHFKIDSNFKVEEFSSEEIVINSSLHSELIYFCEKFSRGPSAVNFSTENFESNSTSLFYLIHKTKRFQGENGKIFLLRFCGELIGISGVSSLPMNTQIAQGGIRTLLNPIYGRKFILTSHVIPKQYEWAVKKGFREFVLTFNEGNKGLAQLISRISQGRAAFFGTKGNEFLKEMIVLPHVVLIHGFRQYVAIKKIDSSFSFTYPSD